MSLSDQLLRRKGRGYKPDEPDKRDWDFDRLALSSSSKLAHSLRDHCGDVYDQGGTSSCVAQAFAGGIEIRESLAGLNVKTPSRLFLYFNSRRSHGMAKLDMGTYLRTCAKMVAKLGAPDEEHWPFRQGYLQVNRRPPWVASMRAHPRMGGSFYRIFDVNAGRVAAIKAAISAGHPVAFGTSVFSSFLDAQGPAIVDKPDSSAGSKAGGHAMLIVGYMQSESHGTIFEVRNSWGRGWREDGYCWLTEDYITAAYTADLQVIDGWKAIQ